MVTSQPKRTGWCGGYKSNQENRVVWWLQDSPKEQDGVVVTSQPKRTGCCGGYKSTQEKRVVWWLQVNPREQGGVVVTRQPKCTTYLATSIMSAELLSKARFINSLSRPWSYGKLQETLSQPGDFSNLFAVLCERVIQKKRCAVLPAKLCITQTSWFPERL